jgi:opacity protein-like surface antigen
MKHLLTLAIALAVVFGTTSAHADVRFGGGAHTGLSFASFPEPANQFYGMGFGGGLNGDVTIIDALTLRLNLDYTRFSSDKEKVKGLFTVTDGLGNPLPFEASGLDATVLSATANAVGRITTGSVVQPYGILGFGLHVMSASNVKIVSGGQTLLDQSVGDSSTRFGLNVGAGTEFLVGPAKLFLEAKYTLIFTDGGTASNIPLTFGVSF